VDFDVKELPTNGEGSGMNGSHQKAGFSELGASAAAIQALCHWIPDNGCAVSGMTNQYLI